MLETDFKDDVLNAAMGGKRRYKQVANSDGTISLEDMTKYDQVGSDYGAGEINTLNKAVNESFSAKDLLKTKEEVAAVTVPGKGVDALVVKELNQSLNGTLRFLDYANSKEVTLSNFTATEDGYLFPTNVYGSSGEVAYMTVNNKTLWVSNFHGIQKRFDFPSLPLRVGDIVKIFNAPFDTNSGYFVPFTK